MELENFLDIGGLVTAGLDDRRGNLARRRDSDHETLVSPILFLLARLQPGLLLAQIHPEKKMRNAKNIKQVR